MVKAQVSSSVVRFRRKLHWTQEYWWYTPFVVQWLALGIFSTIQASRFALTHDFALYWQAVWLIAHGHLNPYSTVAGFPYLDNHFELIMWPVALLYWIWPHASLLLYVQDTALIGAEWLAWQWIRSMVTVSSLNVRFQSVLLGLGVGLLVLNPWMYWAAAFDFHSESIIALTITGAAFAVYRRNPRALVIWAALTLLCGDVAAVALFAVGLTALWRRQWKTALALCIGSLVWLEVITAVHGNQGSNLASLYGYLAYTHTTSSSLSLRHFSMLDVLLLLLQHPLNGLNQLGKHWANLYANAAPSGLLGLASLWSLPLYMATVVVANLSAPYDFGIPGFQNVIIYTLLTIGTMHVLIYIARHSKIKALTIYTVSGVLFLNSLAWTGIWMTHLPRHWIRVPASTAKSLQVGYSLIPHNAEVISNTAIMGRFAGRPWIYGISDNKSGPNYSTLTNPFYVVIAPYAGVHYFSVRAQASMLTQLANMSSAHLVWAKSNAYVWRVNKPLGTVFSFNTSTQILPAWTFHSQTGRRVMGSPPRDWYIAGLHGTGDVINQAYWREKPGTYRVTATIATLTSAEVQVWDATTGTILFQRDVPSTHNHRFVLTGTFPFSKAGPPHVFGGQGLWVIHPAQGHLRNQLEIRIFAKHSSWVNVYRLGIQPVYSH